MGVLLKSENSQLAVDKGINFLKGYFSGREGKARIDAFLENYQKQYEKWSRRSDVIFGFSDKYFRPR